MPANGVELIVPVQCLGCKSERLGVQDRVAYYACGASLNFSGKRIRVTRSVACLAGVPLARIQAAAASEVGAC